MEQLTLSLIQIDVSGTNFLPCIYHSALELFLDTFICVCVCVCVCVVGTPYLRVPQLWFQPTMDGSAESDCTTPLYIRDLNITDFGVHFGVFGTNTPEMVIFLDT